MKQAIDGIEASARLLADQALRQIRSREFDAVPAYIHRVTRDVFMTMFGVPASRWDAWSTMLETMLYHYNPLRSPAERSPYGVATRTLLAEMTALCPAHGGGDLFTRLHTVPHGLNPTETLQSALHFALGGYLSTAFALGTGIHRLLTDPQARAAFDDPLTRPYVIQEMLRFDPPFQTAERRATGHCALHGVPIAKEEIVTVVFGAANRDPGHPLADEADRFQPTRRPSSWADNPAFGAGVHHCIGPQLVGKVLPIYFERWFEAMPALALADTPPRWIGDPAYRGFSSLTLRF